MYMHTYIHTYTHTHTHTHTHAHTHTSARGSIAGANFSALYPAAATCTCKSSQMLCDSLAQLGRAVGWMRRQVARMLPTPVGRRSVDSSLLSHSTNAL